MVTENRKKVAILGATGHIAKNLIMGLSSLKDYQMYLFARTREKLVTFLNVNNIVDGISICDYEQFELADAYDVIINCIGIGNPQELVESPYSVFQITEKYDNLILNYLVGSPTTIYINLSSGAAYGSDFTEPAIQDKVLSLNINHLSVKDFYGISKLNMEAKHRSLNKHKIIDLRIFGFFSSYIDLNSKFLLTDVLGCIERNTILQTSAEDIIRDYVHPQDFLKLIILCMGKDTGNDVYDVYSLKPVSKFKMLEYFSTEHGLRFKILSEAICDSVTGSKKNYYSMNHKALDIGYKPQYTALQSVIDGYQQFRMRNKNEND
ncbi:NAD-dependent epimerase/dehydratase family protein [Paenibacillus monticola]|uniref:NAD-dependent epimerase/dehydratase family protein n=1 Tax=Paenibacillus monticola TaxID=2666075 RepID=A0A7X2H6F2_9BACL|nr:NAD-dependent epimerase/dehydratase family protein [Paenibacillus monticola]